MPDEPPKFKLKDNNLVAIYLERDGEVITFEPNNVFTNSLNMPKDRIDELKRMYPKLSFEKMFVEHDLYRKIYEESVRLMMIE